MLYEGHGPAGVAVLVKTVTDNRNRTGAAIRSFFNRSGGSLGGSGAVAWMFKLCATLSCPIKDTRDFDKVLELALEAGADDVSERGPADSDQEKSVEALSHLVLLLPPDWLLPSASFNRMAD